MKSTRFKLDILIILSIMILCFICLTSITQINAEINEESPILKNEITMTIVEELNEGGGAKDIELVGNTAYVLSDSGLNIYDVSSPSNAQSLGYYYAEGYLGHSIAVYNNHVFAAADNQGLIIIDVSDPSNPSLANSYTNTRPAAIFIQDSLLFLANWNYDFEIYNITNVPLITEVTRFEGNGFSYTYSTSEIAFCFANNGSLLTVDISDPDEISKIGWIDDEEISCITTGGDYWYAGGSGGIKVFDSRIFTNPVLMNHFPETESSHITNLAIQGGFLYASDYHLGFRIFNISNSINLTEIGRNEVGGAPLGFFVEGDFAYVASQNEGVKIVKIQLKGEKSTFFRLESVFLSLFILNLVSRRFKNVKQAF